MPPLRASGVAASARAAAPTEATDAIAAPPPGRRGNKATKRRAGLIRAALRAANRPTHRWRRGAERIVAARQAAAAPLVVEADFRVIYVRTPLQLLALCVRQSAEIVDVLDEVRQGVPSLFECGAAVCLCRDGQRSPISPFNTVASCAPHRDFYIEGFQVFVQLAGEADNTLALCC